MSTLKFQLEINVGLKKISCSCGVSNRLTLLTTYVVSLVAFASSPIKHLGGK